MMVDEKVEECFTLQLYFDLDFEILLNWSIRNLLCMYIK